jgi:hypothetical protein
MDALFPHSAHSTPQDTTAPTITHSIDGHGNLDYSSAGADLAAVIEEEGTAQPISLDDEDWSHTALPAGMPTQGTPANTSDNHGVPFWYPAIALQHAVRSRGDGLGAAFATYTDAHIETLIADAKHAAFGPVSLLQATMADVPTSARPAFIRESQPGRCRVCSSWHPSRRKVHECLRSHGVKLAPTKPGQPARRKRAGTRAAARAQRSANAPPASHQPADQRAETSDDAAPFEAWDEDGVDLYNKNASPNAYAILRRSPPKTASYAQYSAQHERESARLERVSQVRFPRTGTLARCLGPKA